MRACIGFFRVTTSSQTGLVVGSSERSPIDGLASLILNSIGQHRLSPQIQRMADQASTPFTYDGLQSLGMRAREVLNQVHSEYVKTFEEHCCELAYLSTNFIAMEFPTPSKIFYLAHRLNSSHASNYLVVNLSGDTYVTKEFEGQILDITVGIVSPPLDVILRLCASVHKWLLSDSAHVVVVHCNASFLNTAVFFCCYQSWAGIVTHPKECLDLCKAKLGISSWPPSMLRHLTYFELVRNGFLVPSEPLRLSRIVVTVPSQALERPPPALEVWQDRPARKVFCSRFESWESGGLVYGFHVSAQVIGDLSIRIRFPDDGSDIDFITLAFHTAFVDMSVDGVSCTRFSEAELDGSSNGFCVDLFLERTDSEANCEQMDRVPTAAIEEARQGQELFRRTVVQVQHAQLDELCSSIGEKLGVDLPDCDASTSNSCAAVPPVSHSSAESIEVSSSTPHPARPLVTTPDDIDAFFAELDAIAQSK
eukprot:TRINITY_DN64100_c0_g1_i1.p1 TRINITY_DN64100_c0_g1~~TRINITY_DN64100_c0_g1_i1.p1  ORF type:complete len:479 (+),score=42.31 TRINITY_DN64100_c0_g1_i1:226-1662(+)